MIREMGRMFNRCVLLTHTIAKLFLPPGHLALVAYQRICSIFVKRSDCPVIPGSLWVRIGRPLPDYGFAQRHLSLGWVTQTYHSRKYASPLFLTIGNNG
jgi:hypothetical protein